MSDNTPIKRHPAIVSFSKDHHFGLLLVWKIRQGLKNSIDPERISRYVLHAFKEEIEEHFKDEEQFLFSQLSTNDNMRVQAERDHHEIYEMISDIRENRSNQILLNQMADALEKHIRFEERDLFNYRQTHLGASELKEIEKRLPSSSKSCDEKWEDAFWLAN